MLAGSLQVSREEIEHAAPRIFSGRFVIYRGTSVVEEAVIGLRIDLNLGGLAELLQSILQCVHQVRCYESIALSVQTKHRRLKVRQIRLNIWMAAVEDHTRADLRVLRSGVQRQG